MKKNFLYGAFASALVVLSACSNEDAPIVNVDGGNAAQEIVLQVSNTGNGKTRAGRPLLSQEAKQAIENVKLFICDSDNEVVYVKDIANWMVNGNGVSDYTNGRETKFDLKGEDKLKEGNYTIYAIGYHNSSDYDLRAINALEEGSTFTENTVLNLDKGLGEEIFAGSAKVTVTEEIGFKSNIVLNRQVAGAYGYFEKVPYFEGATKLQLVTKSNLNKGFYLGNFANLDLTENGGATANYAYTVNGTTPTNGNIVYTINLKDWYGELKEAVDADGNGTGLFDTTHWTLPDAYKNGFFKKGSVFAGQFIIPFAKPATGDTFELQLVDDNGVALESWSVALDSNDVQVTGYPFWSFNGTAWSEEKGFKDTQSNYNILRNHLYGIGKRNFDVPPTDPGTDPEDPDPDPDDDKPEPLNKKQKLTLRVNSNWEVIHGMVIE